MFDTFASIDLDDDTDNTYVSKLFKYDVVKPTGWLTALVKPIAGQTGKYQAQVTVKAVDDYDPHPEVVFDSIQDVTHKSVGTSPFATANYALNIPNNPSKGLYPTSITFTASPMEVKKYLIKYKVTDASSNETILSTMVSIPKL